MTDILTTQQLKELTGASTKARMVSVLVENGVPFIVKANGWPVTTLSAVNEHLNKKAGGGRYVPPAKPVDLNDSGFRLPLTASR